MAHIEGKIVRTKGLHKQRHRDVKGNSEPGLAQSYTMMGCGEGWEVS